MPIYQYKCKACDIAHEKLQKFNEGPAACPQCGDNSVEKQTKQVSSNTGICLMGHGWTKNGMSVSSRR